MKTIVYQSYRTENVPQWIETCMKSVREWSQRQGYDYAFIDDELYNKVPPWYLHKVKKHILFVSDLARLILAKEYLQSGYERSIWIDADVIIFDHNFKIDSEEHLYQFSKELWIEPDEQNNMKGTFRVNNAVSLFRKGNPFLDFYIHACLSMVKHNKVLEKCAAGPDFLTHINQSIPIPIIPHIGLFSPIVLLNLVQKFKPTLDSYSKHFGEPVYAANLCSSFANKEYHGHMMNHDFFQNVVNKLTEPNSQIRVL